MNHEQSGSRYIHRALQLYTAPSVEPISVDQLKAHCRISSTDEDALIALYAIACRKTLERILGLAFIDTTFVEYWDDFPQYQLYDAPVELYRSPLSSVTSIKYTDTAGNQQTLVENTNYQVDKVSRPPRILPAYGTVWPVTRRVPNAVQVTYKAGFGADATFVPEDLKLLLMLFFAMSYEERLPITGIAKDEVPVPVSFRQLIANNAVWGF